MRLRRARISNFRSVRELEIDINPYTALVGRNNSGKSNVFAALGFLFGGSNAKCSAEDFCSHASRASVSVEAEFDCLDCSEVALFGKYARTGVLTVRKSCVEAENGPLVSYQGLIWSPCESWLRPEFANEVRKLGDLDAVDNAEFVQLVRENLGSARVSKGAVEAAQEEYIRRHVDEMAFTASFENESFMGRRSIPQGLLGDFYLVPAVREVSDDLKVQSTTTFGRLVSDLVERMTATDPQFAELVGKLRALTDSLNKGSNSERPKALVELEDALTAELDEWGVGLDISISPPEVERVFQLGTEVYVDDGVRTLAERKGHGLQRALIMALIRHWGDVSRRDPTDECLSDESEGGSAKARAHLAVFAVEEPELYLHPQAQRDLRDKLLGLVERLGQQVLVSTHSPFFVDLEQHQSICILRKEKTEDGTKICQCKDELFAGQEREMMKARFNMAYWFNPDRNEMFFARRIVLVEGSTEKTIIPLLAESMGVFAHDVSLVDCGSKFNIPLYVEVANAFGLDYMVIHDEDPVKAEVSTDRHRAEVKTFALNKVIADAIGVRGCVEILSPDFEGVARISGNQVDKWGSKRLAAMDRFAVRKEEIPLRLQKIVRRAYAYSDP